MHVTSYTMNEFALHSHIFGVSSNQKSRNQKLISVLMDLIINSTNYYNSLFIRKFYQISCSNVRLKEAVVANTNDNN